MILQIHPNKKIKAVINCNRATHEFRFSTVILLAPFGRTLAQQKTVVPDKNVPKRHLHWVYHFISENYRKSYVVDLANDVFCNFLPEALMNTFSSYEAAYWLRRISYNFLICCQIRVQIYVIWPNLDINFLSMTAMVISGQFNQCINENFLKSNSEFLLQQV